MGRRSAGGSTVSGGSGGGSGRSGALPPSNRGGTGTGRVLGAGGDRRGGGSVAL